MAAPTITALPDAPERGESFSTFTSKANSFVDALSTFVSETNTVSEHVEDKGTTAENAASEATASRDAALAVANFEGEWADLTGSLSVPAAVRHDNIYWMLLNDLADVTASEPAAGNSDWGFILNNLFDDVTDFSITYDGNDRVDTITETLNYGARTVEYAYNGDGTVNTATITVAGRQRVETLSYSGKKVTGMSSTEGDAP
ncbi:hypothetical protein [Nitrosococcus wardiae]|uniref:Uncharacterized protein n=1 Tax=Nitrosococcus wardiae TaxID=1814290 RepID=A0A4P7C3F0_9GAMM|nr:hypothetical protein [Nitrosococcus wardiae]QBQ56197.1 hypothetical protein E3U44_18080 [Nitrosococcus wardiae]